MRDPDPGRRNTIGVNDKRRMGTGAQRRRGRMTDERDDNEEGCKSSTSLVTRKASRVAHDGIKVQCYAHDHLRRAPVEAEDKALLRPEAHVVRSTWILLIT